MLDFVRDYKANTDYRDGFFALAKAVFGINFAPWHDRGFWSDDYVCYTYFDGARAVANVSVNRMSLVIGGKPRPAYQIGTVMTHPDHAGRGLAKDLMTKTLADCDKERDLVYLLANQDVMGFYPKFGFTPVPQYVCSCPLERPVTSMGDGRFLDVLDKADTALILGLIAQRRPVSNVFGVLGAEHILMFYAHHGFGKCFYFSEKDRTIVVFRQLEGVIHLYDVIAPDMPALSSILKMLPLRCATGVAFHFTPDLMGVLADKEPLGGDDTLFVRTSQPFPSVAFQHPALAQA
jgi:GNAT superfamily N-acetyltransferase